MNLRWFIVHLIEMWEEWCSISTLIVAKLNTNIGVFFSLAMRCEWRLKQVWNGFEIDVFGVQWNWWKKAYHLRIPLQIAAIYCVPKKWRWHMFVFIPKRMEKRALFFFYTSNATSAFFFFESCWYYLLQSCNYFEVA